MTSLATAFFAAALAFLAKIYFDYRQNLREKRGIAAALAGEIGAYLDSFVGTKADGGFLGIAALDLHVRISRLKASPPLPAGHPVFDKIADKLGALSISEVEGVSRFYNAVTGFRMLHLHLSSDQFLNADDNFQIEMLKLMGQMYEGQVELAQVVLRQLKGTASKADWTEMFLSLLSGGAYKFRPL